jgi:large subunit ribosomal protein L21
MNSSQTLQSNDFAIISLFGKQYKVRYNDCLIINKIPHKVGDIINTEGVLGYSSNSIKKKTDELHNCNRIDVSLQILSHEMGKKLIHFHKRRRKNSRQRRGHLQFFTKIIVNDIKFN